MTSRNRLAGHALPSEGRLYQNGFQVSAGKAVCTCGEHSGVLPNPTARQRWHRQHKDEVRAKQDGGK